MAYRSTPLVTGEIYHIFNRGVEKRLIFTEDSDRLRFLNSLVYYHNNQDGIRYSVGAFTIKVKNLSQTTDTTPIIKILCYCCMLNHFHLLIRQQVDHGITKFGQRLLNSYTKYFNTKYRRVGPLFQGQFKAVRIESDEQLLHVSRYIHLNPYTSKVVETIDELKKYRWSSLKEYLGLDSRGICDKEIILGMVSQAEYRKFVFDYTDYARSIEMVRHLTLE